MWHILLNTVCRNIFTDNQKTPNTCLCRIMYGRAGVFLRKKSRIGKNKYLKMRRICTVVAVLLVLLIIFLCIDRRMRMVICDYSASVGETVMIKTVDKTVSDIFSEQNIGYGDLVTLNRDSTGQVTSLEVNAAMMNSIKSQISVRVAEAIAGGERYKLSIPLGTIIGNEYTLGRGPNINFKMQITTTIIADFESKFYSAGINQVLHQIHIKVKMNGQTLIPWYRSKFNVETSVIAAQTVIVGISPEAYTNVIENGSDATEDIFDFGAY